MSVAAAGPGPMRSRSGRAEEVPARVSPPLAALPCRCTPVVPVFLCSKEKDRAKAPVKKKEDPSAIKEREV